MGKMQTKYLKNRSQKQVKSKKRNNKKQTAWWSHEIKTQIKLKKMPLSNYLSNKTEHGYD